MQQQEATQQIFGHAAGHAADYAARDADVAEPDFAADPAAARRCHSPSGWKVTRHPKCFWRPDKFTGGEEKLRELSYDFRIQWDGDDRIFRHLVFSKEMRQRWS